MLDNCLVEWFGYNISEAGLYHKYQLFFSGISCHCIDGNILVGLSNNIACFISIHYGHLNIHKYTTGNMSKQIAIFSVLNRVIIVNLTMISIEYLQKNNESEYEILKNIM